MREFPVRRKTRATGRFKNPTEGLYSRVVVHRAGGFRLVIYTLDHEPAHVHVTGPGQAKINLRGPDGAPELVYSIGIGRTDLRRLMSEVAEHRDRLLKEWERIHGPD